jgi:hypothetical protein
VSAFQAEEDLGFQTDEEELLLQSKKVGNLFMLLPTDSKSLLWMPASLVDDDSKEPVFASSLQHILRVEFFVSQQLSHYF